MKKQKTSIKKKITLWYTGIVAVILICSMSVMLFFIHKTETNAAEEELRSKVIDFCGQIVWKDNGYRIPKELEYYDEGVLLSIYSNEGVPLEGSMPSEFPREISLKHDRYQSIKQGEDQWIVYDYAYYYTEGKALWIRAISTVYGIERVMNQIMTGALLISVGLILSIGAVGYWMLSKALKPVDVICMEADEISKGEDLTKRLTIPKVKDEMYHLTQSFNEMFDRLEVSFESEKQFSSDVSHELRTPLAVIRSECEYLLGEVKTEEEREEIRIILQQAEKMTVLISQLLTISRCERGGEHFVMDIFDFSFMADMVADTLEEQAADRKIRIESKIEEGLMVCGEETLLMRMLMNLMENAIFYGKEGGYVRIEVRKNGDYVEGVVSDNGIGICEENLNKIWNRFYREDKSRKNSTNGTGLGLSMVKWIVQIHNGTIHVKSKKGEGTQFVFLIPFSSKS